MHKIISLISLLAPVLIAAPAFAWNRAGHMVSGAIAYNELQKNSPQSVAKVVTVLKKHPDYQSRWQPLLTTVAASDRNLYLFMLAARWADDARGNTQFDRPTWHYVNFPFTLGSTPTTTPTDTSGEENILVAFQKNRTTVQSNTSIPNKAVSLCWIFHLTGDIHQPLHTTKAISSQFPLPEGDRGGTRFYIRVKPDSSTISLHKFWDDLILGSERFQSVRNQAIALRQNQNYQRSKLSELSETEFERWATVESFKLSEQVYQNGTLQGSNDKTNGTVLPPGYVSTVKGIAERRIVLAGYRLADFLKASF